MPTQFEIIHQKLIFVEKFTMTWSCIYFLNRIDLSSHFFHSDKNVKWNFPDKVFKYRAHITNQLVCIWNANACRYKLQNRFISVKYIQLFGRMNTHPLNYCSLVTVSNALDIHCTIYSGSIINLPWNKLLNYN